MKHNILNARILIVDDQQVNIELIRNVLEMEGYFNLMEITDSREVVRAVKDFEPNLILLDLMMPHVSGFDILKLLKEQNLNKETMPVMVLTADTTYETKKNALLAGAKDFLTKPFDLLEVNLRIKNLLSAVYLMIQQQSQNEVLEEMVAERTAELNQKNKELLFAKIEAEKNATQYRTLFNANKDAILLFPMLTNGTADNFLKVNEGAVNLFGYSAELFANQSVYKLGFKDVTTNYVQFVNSLNLNQSIDLDLKFKTPGGKELMLETKSIKIEIDEKPVIMLIARDITERNRHIETIEAQNTSLKKVAFTQSHVVRAPVSRIMGLINLLQDESMEESPEFTQKDMLNAIVNSAHELDGIIRDFTKITYEALTFEERMKKTEQHKELKQ